MSIIQLIAAYLIACVVLAFGAGVGIANWMRPGPFLQQLPILVGIVVVLGAIMLLGVRAIVRWAKLPLDGFRAQVQALSEGRFVSIPEPTVTEWVTLSKALNVMVARVQLILTDKDERIAQLKDELGVDALTGVASRPIFIDRLKVELSGQGLAPGAAVMVRVHDLVGMNQRAGRERADEFLRALATILRTRLYQLRVEHTLLARMNGSDFGLLLPTVTHDQLKDWLDSTSSAIQDLYANQVAESPNVAWIGASTYDHGETLPVVLTRVDTMLMASETNQKPYCITKPGKQLHTIAVAQWRTVIDTALDSGRVALKLHPVRRVDRSIIHTKADLEIIGPDGSELPAELVLPPAIRSGRIVHIDLRVIELALQHLGEHEGDLAVHVSIQSVRHPFFLRRLNELLSQAGVNACRLWFEVPESGMADAVDELLRLAKVLHQHSCRLGISHFGQQLATMPKHGKLRIDYIKLDARFCKGVHTDIPMQRFVQLVVRLANELNIIALGCGTDDIRDKRTLAMLRVVGMVDQDDAQAELEESVSSD